MRCERFAEISPRFLDSVSYSSTRTALRLEGDTMLHMLTWRQLKYLKSSRGTRYGFNPHRRNLRAQERGERSIVGISPLGRLSLMALSPCLEISWLG